MDGTVPPTKVDLSLVSFDDLVNEIFRRHDFAVIGCLIGKTVNQYNISRRYKGNRYACMGICENLKSIINDEENRTLGPVIE